MIKAASNGRSAPTERRLKMSQLSADAIKRSEWRSVWHVRCRGRRERVGSLEMNDTIEIPIELNITPCKSQRRN